jgi:hypothetical protein
MRRALVLPLVALAAFAAAPSAAAQAVRVVDRTFVCTLDRSYAAPRQRAFRLEVAPARRLPFALDVIAPAWAGVATGTAGPTSTLLAVRARQYPRGNWQPPFGPGGPGVYVNTRRCAPARATPALSNAGLPGQAVHWEKSTDCDTPGRAVVRVRARLAAATSWSRVDAAYTGAVRNIADASVSVRTERGAPLAFVRLQGSRIALWYGGRCR